MNMASTTLNIALVIVVVVSTVDCKPVTMDELGIDTSVDTAFCTVILDEAFPAKNCEEDTRYTVEISFFNTRDNASISVSFIMTDEKTQEIETSPETSKCQVDAAAGSVVACGNLGYISWFHISEENPTFAGTKTVRVTLTLNETGPTR